MYGILPVSESLKDIYNDLVLFGKLIFFEKGFMFIDQRFHAIVVPYLLIKTMTIYQTQEWWLEVLFEDKDQAKTLFPCNMITDSRLYLKVNQQFFKDKFAVIEKILMVDKENHISKMTKSYEDCQISK